MTPDKKHKDAEWLRQKYVEEGLSEREVADLTAVSRSTVRRQLDEHEIERRNCPSDKPPQFITANGYEVITTEVEGECKTIGVHQLVAIADGADPEKVFSNGEHHVHHKNGNSWHNVPENVVLLSREEHGSVTNQKVTDSEITEATQTMSQYHAGQSLGVSQSTVSRRVNEIWSNQQ